MTTLDLPLPSVLRSTNCQTLKTYVPLSLAFGNLLFALPEVILIGQLEGLNGCQLGKDSTRTFPAANERRDRQTEQLHREGIGRLSIKAQTTKNNHFRRRTTAGFRALPETVRCDYEHIQMGPKNNIRVTTSSGAFCGTIKAHILYLKYFISGDESSSQAMPPIDLSNTSLSKRERQNIQFCAVVSVLRAVAPLSR